MSSESVENATVFRQSSLRRTFRIAMAATVAVVGAAAFLGVTKMFQIKKLVSMSAGAVPPPAVVSTMQVKVDQWENTIRATASIATVQGVTVSAEAAGKVTGINFESGAFVKKGDLLATLESATEQAQLASAQSSMALARANLDRAKSMLDSATISKVDFDTSSAQFQQASSAVDSLVAVIAKKNVRAPFDGRLGIRLVNTGQILKEGDAIATLQTLDPIYANFSLPQQRVSQLTQGLKARVMTDAAPGKVFDGHVTAYNPDVDLATRSVRVQVTLPNKDEMLRPGMFASVEVILPASTSLLAVPATSILYAPSGDSVFVVDEKKDDKTGNVAKVLRQQLVRVGRSRGDFVEVVTGIKEGDTIVTAGVFKLRSGMPVTVDNTLAPDAKLNPKPNDA